MPNKVLTFITKNYLPLIICFFAITGFTGSFILTLDKFDILSNPDVVLPCDISNIFSCGIVMRSRWSEIFGIPWSLLGIAGYPAALLTGILLMDRKKLNPFLTFAVYFPPFLAFVLSTWFMWLSAYVIGTFCPWCIVSAVSSTSIYFALTIINLKENNFRLSAKQSDYLQAKIRGSWHVPFIVLWFIFMIVLVWLPFGVLNR
jgi:uncharacterized membrane protein